MTLLESCADDLNNLQTGHSYHRDSQQADGSRQRNYQCPNVPDQPSAFCLLGRLDSGILAKIDRGRAARISTAARLPYRVRVHQEKARQAMDRFCLTVSVGCGRIPTSSEAG